LIIDPWGTVIAEAASDDEVILATLDMTLADKARLQIPALFHGATYRLPEGGQGKD
ncbi:MAG TPA: amidohydrolase, partial [Rhodobiaceae bacterium]|nr:amidohydrolase [Rhodobiaceae bacterium]